MAIKTVWPVEHSCGHEQDHDLSDKRPSERAGYARWLASKDCSDCWRACRDKQNGKDKERWLGDRRAEEAATIESWERSCAMPALDGSDKAVAWASQIRHQLMVAAHEHAQSIGVSGDDFGQQVEAPCRRIAWVLGLSVLGVMSWFRRNAPPSTRSTGSATDACTAI